MPTFDCNVKLTLLTFLFPRLTLPLYPLVWLSRLALRASDWVHTAKPLSYGSHGLGQLDGSSRERNQPSSSTPDQHLSCPTLAFDCHNGRKVFGLVTHIWTPVLTAICFSR